MSSDNSCQTVINIEDEDEEVEVIYTNLKTAHVYRNLMCQKISQEIELLQAMYKHSVPQDFNMFKEHAKNLGFTFGDDIIKSAWQRIIKKFLTKVGSLPNSTAPPVCRVKPLEPTANNSLSKTSASISSLNSSEGNFATPPSTTAVNVVPVALILNKAVRVGDASLNNSQTSNNVVDNIGMDCVNENTYTSNENDSVDESTLQNTQSKKYTELASKDNIFRNIQCSDKRKIVKNVFNRRLYEEKILEKSSYEDINDIFTTMLTSNNDSAVLEKSDQSNEHVFTAQNSCCPKPTSFSNTFYVDNNYSSGKKKKTDNTFLGAECWPTTNEKSAGFNAQTKVKQKASHKHKSSNKNVLSQGSQETKNHIITKSHVGVKASIVKTKKTASLVSKKRKKIIEMSESELKEFKEEQKRLKYKEKQEFEMQQLQKVHDRLVDVLIPKYYNKDINDKG